MNNDKRTGVIKRGLARIWGVTDKYLWGTAAGKLVVGAVLALALAPIAPPALIAALAEPTNQILDALSEDPLQ